MRWTDTISSILELERWKTECEENIESETRYPDLEELCFRAGYEAHHALKSHRGDGHGWLPTVVQGWEKLGDHLARAKSQPDSLLCKRLMEEDPDCWNDLEHWARKKLECI
jgi:hypothetical protein